MKVRLGDGAENFAADILGAGFFISEESGTRGDDSHAVAVEIVTDVRGSDVLAASGSGDALQRECGTISAEGDDDEL